MYLIDYGGKEICVRCPRFQKCGDGIEIKKKGGIHVSEDKDLGVIRIANDVVAVIASIVATEIDGIASMSGGIVEGLAKKSVWKERTERDSSCGRRGGSSN